MRCTRTLRTRQSELLGDPDPERSQRDVIVPDVLAARGQQAMDALGLGRQRDVVIPQRGEQRGDRGAHCCNVIGKLIVVFGFFERGNRAFAIALSMHGAVGVSVKSPCC